MPFRRAIAALRFLPLAAALGAFAASAGALKTPGAQAGDALHPLRPGYLGVSLRDLDAAEATRLHLPPAPHPALGAMVVTVDRDAPAWSFGLRPGDVVLELNAQPVADVEDLRRRLRECRAGETITIRILRQGGEQRSLAIPLGDQDSVARAAMSKHIHTEADLQPANSFGAPGPAFAAPAPAGGRGVASTLFDALIPASIYTGLECDPLTPQLAGFFGVPGGAGLLVTGVNPDSPAAAAGLAAGDVILQAAGKPTDTRGALAHALRDGKGKPVALAVMRNRQELNVQLQPAKRKKL